MIDINYITSSEDMAELVSELKAKLEKSDDEKSAQIFLEFALSEIASNSELPVELVHIDRRREIVIEALWQEGFPRLAPEYLHINWDRTIEDYMKGWKPIVILGNVFYYLPN